MDILILDSWLREFLATPAKPVEIAKYLSLCGPSIERIEKIDNDYVYHIEITTNRIDTASVYGIAREASAILPRFNIPAKLKQIRFKPNEYVFINNVNYLSAKVDKNICSRFTTALINNVEIGQSNEIVRKRLESANIRPVNNIVDISNYIMLELGQPVHTFDYDKILGSKMILRESRKGEKITTLDGKDFVLPGRDIVIEDGEGRLIDLAGIMGGKLSEVDNNTKNVLLFVQTYNPINIRKTSMALSQRTQAAAIFEKGTDEEIVGPAILRAIQMFVKLANGKPEKNILDIYPSPFKEKTITLSLASIYEKIGIEIPHNEITKILTDLGFDTNIHKGLLTVTVFSSRNKDINIPEDIIEEIARIYGYHNLPSKIMNGNIPDRSENPIFAFERNIKNIISGFGGTEIYTLSLVSKKEVEERSLKIKNPLGPDTEYLRTSLMPSLTKAVKDNIGVNDKLHLYEMANIYIPKSNNLPEEKLMLSGVFSGYEYRDAKGIVEAVLKRLFIDYKFKAEESKYFGASRCAFIYASNKHIGKIGYIENTNLIYYELEVNELMDISSKRISFEPISKYPSQDEDITFHVPKHTHITDVIDCISCLNKRIQTVEFVGDIFNDNYTIHVKYHDNDKTLNDHEVEMIRKEIISSVKNKFGGTVK